MHRTALLRAASALVIALAAGRAHAGQRVVLRWEAPAGCPGAADLEAAVDRLLGSSKSAPATPIEVTATAKQDAGGRWHAHLQTGSGGEVRERDIHGASCRAIADATALIVALMVDPDAVSAAPAAPPVSAAPPAPAAPPAGDGAAPAPGSDPATGPGKVAAPGPASPDVPVAPPASAGPTAPAPGATSAASVSAGPTAPAPGATSAAPVSAGPFAGPPRSGAPPARRAPRPRDGGPRGAPGPSTPVGARLFVSTGMDVGSLPGVSAGLGAGAALLIGAQRIEATFTFRLPSRAYTGIDQARGGDVDLLAGALGTCRYLVRRPVEVAPCVALEVGRLHAVGFGVQAPGEASSPWAAATAGGLLGWAPVQRLVLGLRADLAVALAAPTFVLEGAGPVHRPGAVAGRLAIAAEVAF